MSIRLLDGLSCVYCDGHFASDLPLRDHMRSKHPHELKADHYRRFGKPSEQRAKAIRRRKAKLERQRDPIARAKHELAKGAA